MPPRLREAATSARELSRLAARWMLRMAPAVALLATALAEPGHVHADGKAVSPAKAEAPVDKWQYHLFNPTPREHMREMSTDRPDSTESPITVDAGHFQIESSLFDYGRTKQGGIEEEVFTYGAVNFKVGLLNNVDIQFVFDAYTEVRTKDRATNITETVGGYSDLQVRLKINLWGNDGGNTALAFFPFVKIPTGSDLGNDNVEGGLILPFSVGLTEKIGLGLMLEVDFVYDDEERSYEAEIFHTAVLGFDLTDKLGFFVEYAGTTGSAEFDYIATANAGFTYGVTDDLQLDTGVRVGLNDAAEDFGVFAGFSVRF
jgi:hypothetical protein